MVVVDIDGRSGGRKQRTKKNIRPSLASPFEFPLPVSNPVSFEVPRETKSGR